MTAQSSAPTEAGAPTGDGAGTLSVCTTSVGRGTDSRSPDPTSLWARVRLRALAGPDPLPEYGTPAWWRLPERDPRRYAALIVAAESSRRPRPPVRPSRPTTPPPPPRPVRASAGWPPVAIPGRPGWRRHLVDGRQVDLPHDQEHVELEAAA